MNYQFNQNKIFYVDIMLKKLYISCSLCKFDVPVAQYIFTSEKSFSLRLGRMSICKRRCPSRTQAMATTLKPFRQGRLSLLWSGARSLAVLRVREKLVNNLLFSKIKITHKLPMYRVQTGILIKSKHHKRSNIMWKIVAIISVLGGYHSKSKVN